MASTEDDVLKEPVETAATLGKKYNVYAKKITPLFLTLLDLNDVNDIKLHFESDKSACLFQQCSFSLVSDFEYTSDDKIFKQRNSNMLLAINHLRLIASHIKRILAIQAKPPAKDTAIANFQQTLELIIPYISLPKLFSEAFTNIRGARIITHKTKNSADNIINSKFIAIHAKIFTAFMAYIEQLKTLLDELAKAPKNAEALIAIINCNILPESETFNTTRINDILFEIKKTCSSNCEDCNSLFQELLESNKLVTTAFEMIINSIVADQEYNITNAKKFTFKPARQISFDLCGRIARLSEDHKLNSATDSINQQEKIYGQAISQIETLFNCINELQSNANNEELVKKYKQFYKNFTLLDLSKSYKISIIDKLASIEARIFSSEIPLDGKQSLLQSSQPAMKTAEKENLSRKATACSTLIDAVLELKPSDDIFDEVIKGFSLYSTFKWKLSTIYDIYGLWSMHRKKQFVANEFETHGKQLLETLTKVNEALLLRYKKETKSIAAEPEDANIKVGNYFLEYTLQKIFKILQAGNPTLHIYEDQTLRVDGFKTHIVKALIDFRKKYPAAGDNIVSVGEALLQSDNFLNYQKLNDEFIPEFLFFAKEHLGYEAVNLAEIGEGSAFHFNM